MLLHLGVTGGEPEDPAGPWNKTALLENDGGNATCRPILFRPRLLPKLWAPRLSPVPTCGEQGLAEDTGLLRSNCVPSTPPWEVQNLSASLEILDPDHLEFLP